jgi:hypothetical protein
VSCENKRRREGKRAFVNGEEEEEKEGGDQEERKHKQDVHLELLPLPP